jgi:hypothetical protein
MAYQVFWLIKSTEVRGYLYTRVAGNSGYVGGSWSPIRDGLSVSTSLMSLRQLKKIRHRYTT